MGDQNGRAGVGDQRHKMRAGPLHQSDPGQTHQEVAGSVICFNNDP